jgi:hypothetical protein
MPDLPTGLIDCRIFIYCVTALSLRDSILFQIGSKCLIWCVTTWILLQVFIMWTLLHMLRTMAYVPLSQSIRLRCRRFFAYLRILKTCLSLMPLSPDAVIAGNSLPRSVVRVREYGNEQCRNFRTGIIPALLPVCC